jgi:hypothetical protein
MVLEADGPKRFLGKRALTHVAVLVTASVLSLGRAYGGFTVGVLAGLPITGNYVVDLHSVYPFTETSIIGERLQLSARATLRASLVFASAPAFGLVLLASNTGEFPEGYLGVGGGLGFPPAPLESPMATVYGVVGVRVPIAESFHGVIELALASNRLGNSSGLGVGVEYTFGSTVE